MRSGSVPIALSSRLGDEATEGLLEVLDATKAEVVNDVLSIAAERFERRLTGETAALRVDFTRELHEGLTGVRRELHEGLAGLRRELHEGLAGGRRELHEGLAGVRQELHEGLAGVRQELYEGVAGVRQDFTREFASMRVEIASVRVELIKWSFAFWIAQVAVVGGLLLAFARYIRVP
jgi:hypothetical protein